MKDRSNATIVVLAVTATLLATALWLTNTGEPVLAAQAESRGASYAMGVARATADQDLLYVIDMNTEQLCTYSTDRDNRNRDILLVTGPMDLQRMTRGAEVDRTPTGGR
jgi:hypothetical protein